MTRAKVEPYKAKNSKGRSYKTVAPYKDALDDGGDSMTHGPAHRATKGQRPGVGSTDKQNPRKQRNRKIEAWCEGGKDYK
jgi:hypothetical protein